MLGRLLSSQYMVSFVKNKSETDEPEANLNEQYHLLSSTMPVKVRFLHSHQTKFSGSYK